MADSADLDWTPEGAPVSRRFGDVYFSREDGLAETRAVFLAGCGLPQAWVGRPRFTVAELGFGTGLNIIALLDLWSRHRPPGGRLSIFSVEAYPLSRADAARALAAWPEMADLAARMLAVWPAQTPGFHRVSLDDLGVSLDLAAGDAADALDRWSGDADAWFLDGFAPSTNPGMWCDAVLDAVAARSAPGARVATFTVAGAVRRGLQARGFKVDKRPGHGRKRERLEAVAPDGPRTRPPGRIVILGAGIAGQAMARALRAQGLAPLVIEAGQPGAGASGFPAALVTPRLDAGDLTLAALYAQALERAGDLYRAVPGAVLSEGVLQLAAAARDPARFDKVAAQPWWGGALMALDPAAASARLGLAVDAHGLWMGPALALAPAAVRMAWLKGVEVRSGRAVGLEPDEGGWRVRLADGPAIVADAVVITAGWGTIDLLPGPGLAPVAGQADWSAGVAPPAAVAWGGYAVPTGEGVLWGATHDRGETAPVPSEAASARNLAMLEARLPALAAAVRDQPGQRRAAVRATTPDRLPLCGEVPGAPGLWVLGGLGSRGFCVAPLLAEHVAARLTGVPSPLPTDLAARVAPDRPGAGTVPFIGGSGSRADPLGACSGEP
ncbi:MAG: tRNA (5-methylaminomethyl-2-thiouridine)(34)-methyltransferase MnmD [Brevundimonas sp.]|jgi:tRNA 5-methylaminomethyl-2-thiouridine biosynthesis bifunctional protein|uniref:tRNA (5-methylaminomethyl-2-thiouridine)(34)-methyltransferase MnmD n=2 Tax=Brevundimonas sp. TaxID=1871086 RepID=UPI0022C9598B|nr:tRNA (5-methylaminomethyl-2-thiouridine)(34)-methyltransferase MnmD [Brevundimonas sp.]